METVLIVEDDGGVRAVLRRVLERLGYGVLEAGHGPQALEVAERHGGVIDLLLADVILPRLHCDEWLGELKRERRELKVLFMSGYSDEVLARAGVSRSDGNFMAKPMTPEALARKVRRTLDGNGTGTVRVRAARVGSSQPSEFTS